MKKTELKKRARRINKNCCGLGFALRLVSGFRIAQVLSGEGIGIDSAVPPNERRVKGGQVLIND
jgi:hypothetical protein